jgi:hypothetical protein
MASLMAALMAPLMASLMASDCIPHQVRPYRPLPLFRADTIVQHYMQPEEFRQFHQRALEAAARDETDAIGGGGGDATSTVGTVAASAAASTGPSVGAAAKAEEQEREQRIAAVYDMFVNAKVMRR